MRNQQLFRYPSQNNAMPLQLHIKKKLSTRTDRVKSVDICITEPWVLIGLYTGHLQVWNYEVSCEVGESFGEEGLLERDEVDYEYERETGQYERETRQYERETRQRERRTGDKRERTGERDMFWTTRVNREHVSLGEGDSLIGIVKGEDIEYGVKRWMGLERKRVDTGGRDVTVERAGKKRVDREGEYGREVCRLRG